MKIPATVVTGFLGAGKTTLIRHLVQRANGRRLALIINEFGDLGVDREVMLGCGIAGCDAGDVIELANGCICCTVADAFLPTMERLLGRERPPDHIVIETSGLALPKPLVQAFNWPDIRSRVTVDGVIAVIDAAAVSAGRFDQPPLPPGAPAHDAPLCELFDDQLACADLVLLNKTDGLDEDGIAAVRSNFQPKLRPGTKVVATVQGALDPDVALGLGVAAEADIDGIGTHHDVDGDDHDHDEFISFVAELAPAADPAAIEASIRDVAIRHDVLRVKGFIEVAGKPMRHVVQAVGPRVERYYDRPWRDGEERRSRLVVIAERGVDAAAVCAALRGGTG
ncbi:MAG: cobalamin biosynthesis protein CobW [Rhodospirillales bacterium]|jgi:cobalamin biosynthesis protein CobW|nr:cobalamin biosynthesis protein CobW [Rhodospirillales bacterium]